MSTFFIILFLIIIVELLIVAAFYKGISRLVNNDNLNYATGLRKILGFIYKNFRDDLWIPIIIIIFVDIILTTLTYLILSVFT